MKPTQYSSGSAAVPRPIAFERGLAPMVLFLVVTTLLFVAVPLVVFPLSTGPFVTLVMMAATFAALAGVAWIALRVEGLSAADVGLGRAQVLPGVLVVVGVYVLVNLAGAAVVFLSGERVTLAVPEGYTSVVTFATAGVAYLVFNGVAEEFAYRAYLQNKLVALLDGGTDRARKGVAILLGVVLFTLAHLPQRVLIMGLSSPGAILGTFVSVVGLGLVLGVLYEYTRNVVLVGVLHGTFNWNPYVVAGMPVGDVVLFVGVPLFLVATWGYRRWATGTRHGTFAPQRQLRLAR